MGFFGFKSRSLKFPKGTKFKDIMVNKKDKRLLILFEDLEDDF